MCGSRANGILLKLLCFSVIAFNYNIEKFENKLNDYAMVQTYKL